MALQNTMLRLSLPTMIASSSLYSGILCCHVPSTMLARRGADIEHKTLDKWRLGRDLTIFAALCFVTGLYFLLFNRSDAAAPAYLVFQTIADIVPDVLVEKVGAGSCKTVSDVSINPNKVFPQTKKSP